MAELVNLDALIPREDFLASAEGMGDGGGPGKESASRTDLTRGESFYITLRKPDFQRETAAWTPESIRDFVKAFIEGDLIPSVICWQSPSRLTFVIDGAHRLSAVIAWLLDDYGDGDTSVKFYNNKINDRQRKLGNRTRELIRESIGTWKELKAETQTPGSNPKLTDRARMLAHSTIPLLWIKGQDSSKAEKAFLTINRSAVQIDPTELKILNSRNRPNAIAARAIVRKATGYKYWQKFTEEGQKALESVATSIYEALYSPPLQEPIRSTDLPIAGHGYGSQTLPLIFDFVNIANDIPVIDASKKRDSEVAKHLEPGEAETLRVIGTASRLVSRITGKHSSSLGLHPAIYFYSSNGRHQPTAVLSVAALVKQLEADGLLNDFTRVRAAFEHFLVEHKSFINQLTTKHGSMSKGYRQIKDYLYYVLSAFIRGESEADIVESLQQNDRYQTLVKERAVLSTRVRGFSADLKQWKFLTEALERSFVCAICRARIDTKSMQLDHVTDQKYGGLAVGDNSAWTHPYCNSTYKDKAGGKKAATLEERPA